MKKRIVFTGGGSAGHVTPNIAIMDELDKQEWEISYIGSKRGIEKELMSHANVPYYGISSGKQRRYVSRENVTDLFKIVKGCVEARRQLKKLKPALVFSKGGFVSVPVVVAAKSLRIPVYLHESDMTPGLANKIAKRFATTIFTSFEETSLYFPVQKTLVTGSPIRKELLLGSKEKARRQWELDGKRPVLTIVGGSLGSKSINEAVRGTLNVLSRRYSIIHICGKNNIDNHFLSAPNYLQFEYVQEGLADLLAATDLVVTRGGSNALFEFLALNIPMLIIPLSVQQSRGDQILNAESFTSNGYGITLPDEELSGKTLLDALEKLESLKKGIKQNMIKSTQSNALPIIVQEINKHL
ncbi:undecaprenyldiphospho-muramoylpentapeptide beta-N-acetylglucosaminyltransferase [Bacillus sp. 1P06AnD]|uniref:undecaprenyldiphospho-muramoylpentapeptide beta-N-acetylglucosaminyltransferase n=1 Tax=Bacillus sp. 1P06AnD TaxID=3132208 RepID=UPI00399F705C